MVFGWISFCSFGVILLKVEFISFRFIWNTDEKPNGWVWFEYLIRSWVGSGAKGN